MTKRVNTVVEAFEMIEQLARSLAVEARENEDLKIVNDALKKELELKDKTNSELATRIASLIAENSDLITSNNHYTTKYEKLVKDHQELEDKYSVLKQKHEFQY